MIERTINGIIDKGSKLTALVILLVGIAAAVYGLTLLGKHLSYSWFYEDLVRETVREEMNMLKEDEKQ